jgi:hypothetical protein
MPTTGRRSAFHFDDAEAQPRLRIRLNFAISA